MSLGDIDAAFNHAFPPEALPEVLKVEPPCARLTLRLCFICVHPRSSAAFHFLLRSDECVKSNPYSFPDPPDDWKLCSKNPKTAASEAALVCHPHPQHGGTMHNKVVYRIARGLRATGAVVLRFNYRGVNLSEGVYDDGEGELEDARVALDYLRGRYPTLPFTLAGFSFGSRIALRLGCGARAARDRRRVSGAI